MRYLSDYIQNPQADHANKSYQPYSKLESGFTLLEMVLVLFLMGMLASATLFLTENVEDQAKYDETKRRIEIMRQAIIGDSTRKLNGRTEVSGFAADMGRLPGCVAELLTIASGAKSPCDDSDIPIWAIDASTGLGSGWRGPYIQGSPETKNSLSVLRFRDGYRNTGDDEKNSGWSWLLYDSSDGFPSTAANAEYIRIQSYGLDGTAKFPAGDLEASVAMDRPSTLVNPNDWRIEISDPFIVNFANSSSTALPSSSVKLALVITNSTLITPVIFTLNGIDEYIVVNDASIASGTISTSIAFPLSQTTLPIGHYAYAIICVGDNDSIDATDHVFDGDCDSDNQQASVITSLRYFSILPRQSLSTLEWQIP